MRGLNRLRILGAAVPIELTWVGMCKHASYAELTISFFFNIIHKNIKVNQKISPETLHPYSMSERTYRAFVTGSTGFIGSHLVDELLARRYRVRCLVRKTSKLEWLENLDVELVYGDLFNERVLEDATKDVDFVYHIAGVTASKTKAGYYRGNQIATRTLLDVCVRARPSLKRFLYVSSLAAVGPSLDGRIVDEMTPFRPITTYGRSKMAAEKECVERFGKLPITIVRPPAVYGPRDTGILTFFQTVKRGIRPQIGFSEKKISLIYVTDFVNGIILAAENEHTAGQTYFFANDKIYTWREIGDMAAKVMKKKALRVKVPVPIVYFAAAISGLIGLLSKKASVFNLEKGRDIVQEAWTCDCTKARNELGYRQMIPIEEGIQKTVQWYQEHGWL